MVIERVLCVLFRLAVYCEEGWIRVCVSELGEDLSASTMDTEYGHLVNCVQNKCFVNTLLAYMYYTMY